MAEVSWDWDKLKEAFDPDEVKWRIGATNRDKTQGMALAYIDARLVMNRLDQVLGPDNWSSQVFLGDSGRVVVGIGIRRSPTSLELVWKFDGAGATDVEGDKGGISDGLKRAAVQWGIGRYLYSVEAPWVAITEKGRSYVIAEHEYAKLRGFLKAKAAVGGAVRKEGARQDAGSSSEEDRGHSAASPPPTSRTRTGFITKDQQKKLYSANFRALKAIGLSEEAINALDSGRKFEPVNYAVAHLGANRLEDLRNDQVTDAISAMASWVQREKWKGDQQSRPAEDQSQAPPDAEDYFEPEDGGL